MYCILILSGVQNYNIKLRLERETGKKCSCNLKFLHSNSFTDSEKSTFLTAWTSRPADVSAMKNQPVVCSWYNVCGDVTGQLFLNTQRSGAPVGNQAYAVAYTENMRIHSHLCLLEYNRLYNVGSLASYSGQTLQFLARSWYCTTIFFHDHACRFYKMTRLAVWVTNTVNVLIDNFRSSFSHDFSCRIVLE